MSLQEYLLAHLTSEAGTPTLDELFERVGHRTGGSSPAKDVVELIRHARDAGVLATALAYDGPDGRSVRDRLRRRRLIAPHLIDVEVLSAWRGLHARGLLTGDRVDQASADLAGLRLRRVPHSQMLPRCRELRATVTPYDASYVALAELLDTTLLTADAKLVRAPGRRCRFDIED